MSLFLPEEAAFVRTLSRLVYANPFLSERITLEREALGDAFVARDSVWNIRAGAEEESPNDAALVARAGALAARARARLASGERPSAAEAALYEDLALFHLYHAYRADLEELIRRELDAPRRAERIRAAFYPRFERDHRHLLQAPGFRPRVAETPAHVLAVFFQVRRAFRFVFSHIVGASGPAARLRAAVWESVFTRDLARYRRALYGRMGEVATLVTGPSGTGKELVARAIGLSRYVPFDAKSACFERGLSSLFFPLHLAALSETLIESELFGHRRGTFTGALEDRPGWFEAAGALGAVFLDEIAEASGAIQVKLLRVLEKRAFHRLGDREEIPFRGKIVAATNRDLAVEMREGRFREDLYYRLCADQVATPSLAEQLQSAPGELENLVRFIALRLAGPGPDGEALSREALAWIETRLPPGYPWPGNVRELEQCVRNILVRGSYAPAGSSAAADPRRELARAVLAGDLPAETLLSRYVTLVYSEAGSYEETARRLDLDRRTVKARVDPAFLARLKPGRPS